MRNITMNEVIYNFSQYYRDGAPLNIIIAGTSYCDRTYQISRNDSKILSFEYILEGEGTLEINGKTFHPRKSDVYLLTRHSNHRYFSDGKNPWTKVWIVFDGAFGEFLFNHYIPAETYLVRNCDISMFMFEILEIVRSGSPYEMIVDRVMVILLKMAQSIKNHLSHLNTTTAFRIEQWISCNVNQKISIEQLCMHFSYSKNHGAPSSEEAVRFSFICFPALKNRI